jgi:hypothetical protein
VHATRPSSFYDIYHLVKMIPSMSTGYSIEPQSSRLLYLIIFANMVCRFSKTNKPDTEALKNCSITSNYSASLQLKYRKSVIVKIRMTTMVNASFLILGTKGFKGSERTGTITSNSSWEAGAEASSGNIEMHASLGTCSGTYPSPPCQVVHR